MVVTAYKRTLHIRTALGCQNVSFKGKAKGGLLFPEERQSSLLQELAGNENVDQGLSSSCGFRSKSYRRSFNSSFPSQTFDNTLPSPPHTTPALYLTKRTAPAVDSPLQNLTGVLQPLPQR